MRNHIDLIEGKSVKKYSFINELGNSIKARVTVYDDDRTEPVKIELEGPDSTMENNITRLEAEKLRDLLDDSLTEGHMISPNDYSLADVKDDLRQMINRVSPNRSNVFSFDIPGTPFAARMNTQGKMWDYLLLNEGKPIGYATLEKTSVNDISVLVSTHIGVLPEYRGSGAIMALYNNLVEHGQILGSGSTQTPDGANLWKKLLTLGHYVYVNDIDNDTIVPLASASMEGDWRYLISKDPL